MVAVAITSQLLIWVFHVGVFRLKLSCVLGTCVGVLRANKLEHPEWMKLSRACTS